QNQRVERIPLDQQALRRELGDGIGPGLDSQQDDPGKKAEPTAAGDQKRVKGGLSRFGLLAMEPDQEERGDARELPEDEKNQEILREDDPQHRDLEQDEPGLEPHDLGVVAEIPPRIDLDQEPQPGDEKPEKQGPGVRDEVQPDPERGNPADIQERER